MVTRLIVVSSEIPTELRDVLGGRVRFIARVVYLKGVRPGVQLHRICR